MVEGYTQKNLSKETGREYILGDDMESVKYVMWFSLKPYEF